MFKYTVMDARKDYLLLLVDHPPFNIIVQKLSQLLPWFID